MILILFGPETSRTLRPRSELKCNVTEELKECAMYAAIYGET